MSEWQQHPIPHGAKWRRGEGDFGGYQFLQMEIFNFKKGIRWPTGYDDGHPEWEQCVKDRICRRFWRYIGAV